jgi:VanZ family protein
MNHQQDSQAHAAVIKSLCVCTVVTILIAGLWPFHAPKNNVEWIGKEDGLQFGRYGSVVSTGAFQPRDSSLDDSGCLEVGIAAAPVKKRHTILAFEGAGQSGIPFRLLQDGHTLIVQRHNTDDQGIDRTAEFGVDRALSEGERVFVTVTLGKQATSIYLNGALARTSSILGSSTGNFTGRLVLGNSPSASDSWPGQILGLAIFRTQLTPSGVVEHYESWRKDHRPPLLPADEPAALYLFNEHAGSLIRNQVDQSTDLRIPAHYFVLHPEFLSLPWRHYHATWSYWTDVAINVLGFIPFGFFIASYFSSVRTMRNSAAITIALGLITSFTIEVAQAFLPTRDSGVNDLITNTFGTAIGVMFCRSSWLQALVSRASSVVAPPSSEATENMGVGSQI